MPVLTYQPNYDCWPIPQRALQAQRGMGPHQASMKAQQAVVAQLAREEEQALEAAKKQVARDDEVDVTFAADKDTGMSM